MVEKEKDRDSLVGCCRVYSGKVRGEAFWFAVEFFLDTESPQYVTIHTLSARVIVSATPAERVRCARKAQVSKNGDGCTHPADVVGVAGFST
jgi:hypothetical protein